MATITDLYYKHPNVPPKLIYQAVLGYSKTQHKDITSTIDAFFKATHISWPAWAAQYAPGIEDVLIIPPIKPSFTKTYRVINHPSKEPVYRSI